MKWIKKNIRQIVLGITFFIFLFFYIESFICKNSSNLEPAPIEYVVALDEDGSHMNQQNGDLSFGNGKLVDIVDGITESSVLSSDDSISQIFQNSGMERNEDVVDFHNLEDNPSNHEYIVEAGAYEGFDIYVLDVGQASSSVFYCDGEYMLFDGGDWGTSDELIRMIKTIGVDRFKYVVISHYDADHAAGCIEVLNQYDVDYVIAPDYVTDSGTYTTLVNLLEDGDFNIIHPYPEEMFYLGSASMECIAPCDDVYDDENDYSVGLKICYNGISTIICGDATKISEQEMIDYGFDLSSDIYIVNHHGSSSSTSENFIQAVHPRICVISAGADGGYGHPTQQTLSRIYDVGSSLYRTDINGNIHIYCRPDTHEINIVLEQMADESLLWQPGN